MKAKQLFVIAPFLFLACGSPEPVIEVSPLDGEVCLGEAAEVLGGLAPVDDPALLQEALGKSGEGKLCFGRVYAATESVIVYRVWNAAKSYTEFGKWWSLTPPIGTVADYRRDNAICPEWSDLNQLTRCTIKKGSHVVIGTGQSATCMAMMYGKSSVHQVYMANDTRVNMLQVEGCKQLGAWPLI